MQLNIHGVKRIKHEEPVQAFHVDGKPFYWHKILIETKESFLEICCFSDGLINKEKEDGL